MIILAHIVHNVYYVHVHSGIQSHADKRTGQQNLCASLHLSILQLYKDWDSDCIGSAELELSSVSCFSSSACIDFWWLGKLNFPAEWN